MSAGALPDPFIGCTFRGHRIERLIASGGMGAVYLARDESLPNVRKVIKILLADPALNESMRAFVHDRFMREALTVSVLNHENIVKIHSVGTLDGLGQPCMLLDYVEGQTLHEYTCTYRGRVPPYRLFPLMCHVARGLDAAHALGIVHRDLKPANIILCPKDGDPWFCMLLDFGVAKFTRPIVGQLVPTMTGTGVGTPCYMAVEQFKHADEATPLSDVYALAIIIWEMVTGELPWGRHDITTPLGVAMLYEMQRDKPPNPPPAGTLGPAWERTLRSALSPNPEERPASVRHLFVDLAVGLEPVGPHIRSGVEILRSIAPRFIAESEPDAETVRDTPHRTIVVAWPRSESPVRVAAAGIPTRRELPHQGQKTPAVPDGTRSHVPVATAATTLGAANGVLLTNPMMSRRRTLAFLAILATAIAAVGLLGLLSGRGTPADALEPSQPATAAQPTTAAPSATVQAPTIAPSATARPATSEPSATAQPTTNVPTMIPPSTTVPARTAPAPNAHAPAITLPVTTAQPSDASTTAQPARIMPRSRDVGAPRPSATTPVKTGRTADPDRIKPRAPDAGSGHKFDPNAVGGQEED